MSWAAIAAIHWLRAGGLRGGRDSGSRLGGEARCLTLKGLACLYAEVTALHKLELCAISMHAEEILSIPHINSMCIQQHQVVD